jgi:hypothetical protein
VSKVVAFFTSLNTTAMVVAGTMVEMRNTQAPFKMIRIVDFVSFFCGVRSWILLPNLLSLWHVRPSWNCEPHITHLSSLHLLRGSKLCEASHEKFACSNANLQEVLQSQSTTKFGLALLSRETSFSTS